jgi:hypothetical protein
MRVEHWDNAITMGAHAARRLLAWLDSEVAGSHHPRGRQRGGVADHTVVQRQPRSLEPAGVGDDADPHHHQVGIDRPAVGQPDPRDPPVVASVEARHRGPQPHVDAVVAVHVGQDCAHLLPQRLPQRHREGLEDGDVEPSGAAGRGHLGADEAGTDHHDARGAGLDLVPHGQAVVQRA